MTSTPAERGAVFGPIYVLKSSDVLADQLRSRILDGEIAEGARLPPERELVAMTGLSRGSVREALRILEVEGFVRPKPGRSGGSIVSLPDNDTLAQFVGQFIRGRRIPLRSLQETRETIEPALARLAAANRTDEEVARLVELNRELAEVGRDPLRFAAINMRWHRLVATAARNELLAALLQSMSFGVLSSTTDPVFDSVEVHRAVLSIHERITDAIAARDGEAAFRRMERHVRATRASLHDHEDRELPLGPASVP